ncbi:hypothetical protein ACEWY4_003806 [Coilia grayii]|uniref:CRC domain-containing protein n=1 Tax=Coilia grayii TaxID=363190 RepID=A0ABD1KSC3_9TELE
MEKGELDNATTDTTNDYRLLYHAALTLKEILHKAAKSSQKLPWPPTANDLTLEKAFEVVPHQLLNFIAWASGIASEPTDERVRVSLEDGRKILSSCQDIISLATRGRWLMPKQCSLAMAVRHMIGSAQLIGMLNGLGHCSSNSLVLEHDTALANLQMERGEIYIPESICAEVPVTLVWDNNDFGEETLSGKGTTHNTNGIVIQQVMGNDSAPVPSTSRQRTRERSVNPPPLNLVTYRRGKRSGPQSPVIRIDLQQDQNICAQTIGRRTDAAYFLMKVPEAQGKVLPGWTGFNIMLKNDTVLPSTNVKYLPVIDASPTDLNTVHTILSHSLAIADSLKQTEVVLVMDQAIYSKAQEIRWQTNLYSERIVLRLGELHTTMAYLSCIGKLYADAGLQDILIESELVAVGSIDGVISGHHYNRSIRAHKLLTEALQRLRWQAYLDTLPDMSSAAAMKIAMDLQDNFPSEKFIETIGSGAFLELLKDYSEFVEKNNCNLTFAFWSKYIAMVEILLLFIRATREGNWALHLSTVQSMLPWFFACDKVNYARYLTAYWVEMSNLEDTHPSAHQQLLSGDFVAQRHQKHGFAGTACDEVIEQTANRDSKTKGGISGFSLNKGAVHRWTLTQHERAAITAECKNMAGQGALAHLNSELDHTRMQRDQTDVKNILTTVHNMVNPFDPSLDGDSLYQISTGQLASESIATDLMQAEQRGQEALTEFCDKRISSGEKSFHDPIKKTKIKTFKDACQSRTIKIKGREITLTTHRNMFARLIVVGSVRQINIEEMLTYCLGPFPQALANVDGSLAKTNKAKLMHVLQEEIHPSTTVKDIPNGSVWIWDAMALVQQLKPQPTFGQYADHVLRTLVHLAKETNSTELHFVCDTYTNLSVKNAERSRRAEQGYQRIKIYGDEQKTPKQWKKFLACGENKNNLLEYFFQRWAISAENIIGNNTIITTHGSKCHAMQVNERGLVITEIKDLESTHEEADTRIVLHAAYAAKSCSDLVIRSPDTDVFVLTLAFCKQIDSHLYFHTGKERDTHITDISRLHTHLGEAKCDALVGLHAFSGCDTVSALHNVGKAKAYKKFSSKTEYTSVFQDLGTHFTPSAELCEALEAFTCDLYEQTDSQDVNIARANLFKSGKCSERDLPPNKDSLYKHIHRASYQAAVHRRSLECRPDVPPPVNHGWKMVGGVYEVDWMTLPPAPEAILELVHCSCKKTHCVKGRCTCKLHDLPCTNLCQCSSCDNRSSGRD